MPVALGRRGYVSLSLLLSPSLRVSIDLASGERENMLLWVEIKTGSCSKMSHWGRNIKLVLWVGLVGLVVHTRSVFCRISSTALSPCPFT